MKRTLDSIKENEVVWCKSPEEAEQFCKLLDAAGKVLCSGTKYSRVSDMYQYELCLHIKLGTFGTRESYLLDDCNITLATDFIEDQQTPVKKADIDEKLFQKKWENHEKKLPVTETDRDELITIIDNQKRVIDNLRFQLLGTKFVPYQLCPMCHGAGNTYAINMTTSLTGLLCKICNGVGIIPQYVIE